jgi:hypothetical protein
MRHSDAGITTNMLTAIRMLAQRLYLYVLVSYQTCTFSGGSTENTLHLPL